ncbi:hypothetical protein ACTFIW_005318 [Dictyostelium discoideum]
METIEQEQQQITEVNSEYYIDENGNYQYYEESYYSSEQTESYDQQQEQEQQNSYDEQYYQQQQEEQQQEQQQQEEPPQPPQPPQPPPPTTIGDLKKFGEEELFYNSLSHRSKCVLEVYTTEKSFSQHLNHFISFYLDGIRNSNPPILDSFGILEIFSNIESIRDFSEELIKDMKKKFQDGSEDVATPFILKEKQVRELFIPYATNHANLVEGLSKMIEKRPMLAQFLQQVKENPLNKSKLDLPSFLIMPVQRMVRYQMLFNEILKHTEKEHTDYQRLEEATQMSMLITRTINEQIRRHQNLLKVQEIQSNLIGGPKIIKENRVFVREGGLMKVCRKEDKFRWFFLFSDALMYCTSTNLQQNIINDAGGSGGSGGGSSGNNDLPKFQPLPNTSNHSFTFHRIMLLSDINKIRDVKDRDNQKNAFQIVSSSEKSFTVYAETQKEKFNWLNDFKELLVDKNRVVQESSDITNSQLNADEVPVWIPDKEATKCMFCNDGFTIINRRHHCRNCGKVVCGSCSPHKRLIPHIKKNKPVRVCLFCYDYIGLNEKESQNNNQQQSSSSSSSSLHINGAQRSHLDILNSIIGDRKRTLSFSSLYGDGSLESNSTQPYNLTFNNNNNSGSNGSGSGSNLNINNNNNIPNSSAGLSNKEHYSTFRKLKNKISKDSSSSSSSITITKEKDRDFSRSQSDLNLTSGGNSGSGSGSSGGSTPTGRPPLVVRGGIPLPTTQSHGNLRPMLPINSVVLKPSNNNNNNNDQPKFQSPEFPQSKLSKTSPQSSSNNLNLITKSNKPPLSPPTPPHHNHPLPQTPPHHNHPLPPTPPPQHPLPPIPQSHTPPQHSLPSVPQSHTPPSPSQQHPLQHPLITQTKKVTRSTSQPPLPEQTYSSTTLQPPSSSSSIPNPLGKSAPTITPSRRVPPPTQPRNSLENNTSSSSPPHISTEQQSLNNHQAEPINNDNNTSPLNSKPLIQPRPMAPPTVQSINQLRSTNTNGINNVDTQLQDLEINTPTKLVGTTIPQKPAAPFRKRSSSTSSEVTIVQQQQPHQQQPHQQPHQQQQHQQQQPHQQHQQPHQQQQHQQPPNLITKSSQKPSNVNNIQNNNNNNPDNEAPSPVIEQPTAPIIKKRPLPQIPNQL